VVDLQGLRNPAVLVGNAGEALMDKAFAPVTICFQQSYPQKIWMSLNSLWNQPLKHGLKKRPEHKSAS
jgi:hypothetical protein